MTTSFCLLLLGALVSFIVARLNRSAKVYMGLLCMLLLGFVVGTGVKSAVANVPQTPSHVVVSTASNPMLSEDSAAVVETENILPEIASKDILEGDTVITKTELVTRPNNALIEDDS